MGENLDRLESHIQEHIKMIAKSSGLPQSDESIEEIARAWWEKKESFESKIAEQGMEEADTLATDSEKGAIMLTYSGSLLTVGPLNDEGSRKVEYTSIGLRQDVPDSAEKEGAKLKKDAAIDTEVVLENGPIQKSSPIFKIAVPAEEMDTEEMEELLGNVTQIVTEDFVEVNKTIIVE